MKWVLTVVAAAFIIVLLVFLVLGFFSGGTERGPANQPGRSPAPSQGLVRCLNEAGMRAKRINRDSVQVTDPATARGGIIHRFGTVREARAFRQHLGGVGHENARQVAVLGEPPVPPRLESAALTCMPR